MQKKSSQHSNKFSKNFSAPSGFHKKKKSNFADKPGTKNNNAFHAKKDDSKNYRDKNKKNQFLEKQPPKPTPSDMPLNKYIAHCGICSRRKAVDFVKEGKVTVNGELIKEPAFKVTEKDTVTLEGKKINLQKKMVYILLNKPKGFITTVNDPEGRQTVMDLIKDAPAERVFPIGRLDRNTSGLLILTNDGELAQKLSHPKNNVKKVYHISLDKPLAKNDFDQILKGVTLEDGIASVDVLAYADPQDRREIGVEIHSGKNRIVRRIFEHFEYKVEKLDRIIYAGLTKKNVPRGRWRMLSEKEIILLKHFK